MTLTLHTLKPSKGSREKSFRIGRGLGSGRGKTAGRGTKGQKSRTGGKKKLNLKGMKQMLLSFPKNRGFQSLRQKPVALRLPMLNEFADGSLVTLETLKEAKLIRRTDRNAKIVGATGELTKKLTISGINVSATAKAAIEKAGGTVKS